MVFMKGEYFMSLIRDFAKDDFMPIFDNVEYAKGCERFIFRAKTEKDCYNLLDEFVDTVPNNKRVKAYRIGLRPDYPIPVARYFLEVSVDDNLYPHCISLWTHVTRGRLAI